MQELAAEQRGITVEEYLGRRKERWQTRHGRRRPYACPHCHGTGIMTPERLLELLVEDMAAACPSDATPSDANVEQQGAEHDAAEADCV